MSPRGAKYWDSALGTPAPGICTGKMGCQYTRLGKSTGQMSKNPKVPEETKISPFGGLMCGLIPIPNENIA